MLTKEQGEFLVKLARQVIEDHANENETKYELKESWLQQKHGVFTTLETCPENELRGCIGIPEPVKPLGEAIIESVKEVTHDPRFPVLNKDELEKITIEVSVLTKPELIRVNRPDEYLKKISQRKDGLIIRYGIASGLFLPQVWEKIPDKKQFLDNLCWKAGLPSGTWRLPDVKIYRFRAQIFKEERPRGKVVEIES